MNSYTYLYVSYFGFQVYDMDEEVKRHRTTQDLLETELQALRQRLFRFENLTGEVTTNESTEEYKSHISWSVILIQLKILVSLVYLSRRGLNLVKINV